MIRVPSSPKLLADLELLVAAHHPLLAIDCVEEERVDALLQDLAERAGLPYFTWTPILGLVRHGPDGGRPPDTQSIGKCLAFLEAASLEAIVHLKGIARGLDDPEALVRVREIYRRYFEHRGTVAISGPDLALPKEIDPLFSHFTLPPPSLDELHRFVSSVLYDATGRRPVSVELDAAGVSELLGALHGLSYYDVRKIVTLAIVDDGKLDRADLPLVHEAKRRILERSNVLEIAAYERTLDDVAGLGSLKRWLEKRHRAFADPDAAKRFGLTPPRGLLLLGVQGCGKSLAAKAIASEWKLPLVRLDPSRLYDKFFGESEKSWRRAIALAESMAPVVLWIDEIEKALGQGDLDGGTSQRIFGTFLTWLSEKKADVFVIATANDISRLPPELLRKGRFDEIFFVDLPTHEARVRLFELHLRRRGHDPSVLDLEALAEAAEGHSGAEIEQAIVSSLYTAFDAGKPLGTDLVLAEIRATRPLSVTMSEKIEALRTFAASRAVRAD